MPLSRSVFVVSGVVVALAAGATVAVAADRPGGDRAGVSWRPAAAPYVHGTQTVRTYPYADAVRESVLVATHRDDDGDGRPDQIAVDLIRPDETTVKVPVIMDASPYYESVGRGSEHQVKKYDAAGTITSVPLFEDNYFVPRGYALVAVDLAGTNRSTGCMDLGGPAEVAGVTAVIDWLNGRATATHRDGTPAVATTWTTGKVGMIGKSWDGSIANAVAATGIEGLVTVVPESAISSWYDYLMINGVNPPGYDVTSFYRLSSRLGGECDGVRKALRSAAGTNGDYNAYWAQRDYRPAASKVRASVFLVHGLGDENVMPSQFAEWWQALGAAHVPRKLWLSREGHVDPFDFRRTNWVDTLHQWFDYWLQGLPNGIMSKPPVTVETGPGTWADQPTWPAPGSRATQAPLGAGTLGGAPATGTRSFTDKPQLTEAAAVTTPQATQPGRLVFLSGALTADLRISGTPAVTLKVRVNKPTTELTARLVDYGSASRVDPDRGGVHRLSTQSCWGDSVTADNACYPDFAEDVATKDLSVVTRGWMDAAHAATLRETRPLRPGQWYPVRIPLQAADAVIPAGHVVGLVITGSDEVLNPPATTGATVDVDLAGSVLDLPATGSLPRDATPPPLTGRDAPGSGPVDGTGRDTSRSAAAGTNN